MFEYLDVATQRVLQKLSNEELYKMTTGRGEDYPLFAQWLTSPLFWSELSKHRFGYKPYDQPNGKQLFQGEYLHTCKVYSEAAEKGSFRALLFLHQDYLKQKNYPAAIKNDEAFIKHYGLVGAIYYCETYQLAVTNCKDASIYAQAAVEMLNKIAANPDSEFSKHYLKELGWEDKFKTQYTDAKTFIDNNRNFFDSYIDHKNSCSI